MELKVNVESKEQAEKIIERLQEFIDKKNLLSPKIEEGDDYWAITSVGDIQLASGKDDGTEFLANIYKTRTIAQKALEFKKGRKVWNFIENWAIHNASSYKPNWDDDNLKYSVNYSHVTKKWFISWDMEVDRGKIYLLETDANKLVNILNSSDEYKL